MSAITIACLGKGGTGKTLISTLLGKIARDEGLRVLLVDADPVMGLSVSCGLQGVQTVADARERIIDRVQELSDSSSEEEIREVVGHLISSTLVEREGLAFIAMGQSRSLGCYCSLNLLLRNMIASMLDRFDLVVVDAEAGIEQVNRQVIERVDQALLLSDGSRRAVQTCLLVRDTIGKIPMMANCRMAVLFNRVSAIPEEHREFLESSGLRVLGFLAPDESVTKADAACGALRGLDPSAASYQRLRALLVDMGIPMRRSAR